ncbi:MAG: hypothetical protein MZU97_24135 [Bacillus subtilis]|nr:hypothetical protein [Bacillus subtilis]
MVAGRVSGGTIEDVQVDVSVNLGTQAIGETYAGGIVGQASGLIATRFRSPATIDAGIHVYPIQSYNVVPRFYDRRRRRRCGR